MNIGDPCIKTCSSYVPTFIYLNTKGSLLSLPLRMQAVGLALEELLVTAQKQDCLTVGIYESAKLLNA